LIYFATELLLAGGDSPNFPLNSVRQAVKKAQPLTEVESSIEAHNGQYIQLNLIQLNVLL